MFYIQGQATDILIHAEEIIKLKKQINQLYVKHTGKDLEHIEQNMERDKFMSPDEAREFGIIDTVLVHAKNNKPEDVPIQSSEMPLTTKE